MPHQMIKFRIDNFIFDLRRQAHLEGRKYGWLDWSFMQWEWVGGVILLIGSFLLTIGSILFLPECGPMLNKAGSYVFVGSSLCYMTTSCHDFLEIVAAALWSRASNAAKLAAATTNEPSAVSALSNPTTNVIAGSSITANNSINWMEWFSAITFLCGACLFMLGTASGLLAPMMMDSMDPFLPTAWSFIIGSCCCLSGSMVNSMQIWDAPDRKSAQYANMIAVHYIIGSSFYLCGSIPYLYFFHHTEDKRNIMRCVALFFIIGSVVFVVGAVINLYRIKWNEKYDPELNWINQQQKQQNGGGTVVSKKPKRISSDIEDPLFIKKDHGGGGTTSRKGKKVERRPSGTATTITRATSRATTLSLASSSGDIVSILHTGNASHHEDSSEFNITQVEKRSSLDYSRQRRRVSTNVNASTSQEVLPSFDKDVSSGLWT